MVSSNQMDYWPTLHNLGKGRCNTLAFNASLAIVTKTPPFVTLAKSKFQQKEVM